MNTSHLLFADGCSLGNPGASGWGAIVVIGGHTVRELGGRKKRSTNNEMELTALLEGLREIENEPGNLDIYTDSSYAINGVTKWVSGWERNGWVTKGKTEVANRALWEGIVALVRAREKFGKTHWHHVPGHSGVIGNERCDQIANAFAAGEDIELYDGPLDKYAADILDVDIDPRIHEARVRDKARSRLKAYSYVSKLGGRVMVHATWAECEARVKGKTGALFRKVASKDEEEKLVKEWRRR
jgi:ribonuclease HI